MPERLPINVPAFRQCLREHIHQRQQGGI
jgi:hypothetical protein